MSFNFWIVLAVLALLLGLVGLEFIRLHRAKQYTKYTSWRLKRLEQKLDLILNQLEVEYEDKTLEMVKDFIKSGAKIEAIKMFRQQTGVSLVEAKRAIEALERGMQ